MTKQLAAACSWICLVVAAPLVAQTPTRSIGLTLARSVGASAAAHPPPCAAPCDRRDLYGPLTVTLLEAEVSVPLLSRRISGVEYLARVVPLALMGGNPTQPAIRIGQGWALPTGTDRASTFGVGAKPLGLRGWVGSNDQARVEVDFSAGALWFDKPLLAANATRLNFVYEFGLGVRFSRLSRGGVVVGYRRHHASNAGMGEVNPGLNSHVVLVGLPVP